MPTLTLSQIPGFSDLPDSALAHDTPARGIALAKISNNIEFGMVDFEVFQKAYSHGQTVDLPISPVDKYQYSRSELIYSWGISSTLNPTTSWISGPDTLWYAAWNVANWDDTSGADNSKAGLVECFEWYRRSGSNYSPTNSNDGTLVVTTVAQRSRSTIIMATQADAYTDIDDSSFVTDAALTESMAQTMNRNAKFAIAQAECKFMGEFTNGQTIPLPVSQKDGYEYAYSQVKFVGSWRWTTSGSSFAAPDLSKGQLAPIIFSIDAATGVVTVQVYYVEDSGDLALESGFGRIAVVAYCSRNNLIGTFGSTANSFSEIDPTGFFPGQTLRASTALQLNKNIREAVANVEFFGPTEYADNTTISAPTSTIDSYAYSRSELIYAWEWSDTTPDEGNNLRTLGWIAQVNASTGGLALNVWRLPPGSKYVIAGSANHMRLRVLTIAIRKASIPPTVLPVSSEPSDGGPVGDQGGGSGSVTGNGDGYTVSGNAPYTIAYYSGPTGQPAASAILLSHYIAGLTVPGVRFPADLTGSYVGCVTAPTADFVITIKQAGATVGTMTIAAGATTGSLAFSDDANAVPGELWTYIAPATPDTTIAGIFFTQSGIRIASGSTNPPVTDPGSGSGGGGAANGQEDLLNWVLNADRANTHYTGTDNPFYTYIAGNKFWWMKGSAGHPWDIQLFDSTYIYLWITENGDAVPSAWANASAYKRYAVSHGDPTPQGVKFAPRFYTPGSPVTLDSASPNNIHRTINCEADAQPLINIGNIRCVTAGPTSEAWGGDVGTRDTIIVNYYYGSSYGQRERFHLVKGVGHVSWDYATGTYGGSYTIHQATYKITRANGGSPTPVFPCATGASWWI